MTLEVLIQFASQYLGQTSRPTYRLKTNEIPKQCDQIGRFLKVLGGMASIIGCPNAWLIFGLT